MALPIPGDIHQPTGSAELRDQMLTDYGLAVQQRDPDAVAPVDPKTDVFLLFGTVANAQLLLFANIAINDQQSDFTRATGESLARQRIANGLPEVVPSPSTGRVKVNVVVAVPFPDGLTGRLPNGVLLFVNGTQGPIGPNETVAVITENGANSEAPAGTAVTWLNPPAGIETDAEVSIESPLVGGQDEETDERTRLRIANNKRFPPQPGAPGQLIADAFAALGTVQQAYVYSALGGPSSEKTVVVRAFSRAAFSFSRAFTETALDIVRQFIQGRQPRGEQHVITTVDELDGDVALQVRLPNTAATGGDNTGWLDDVVWPPLDGGDTRVEVSVLAPAPGFDVRVNASTTTPPIAGITRIAWWSPSTQTFLLRRVITVGGSPGGWFLGLDAPLVDKAAQAVAVGDYISPGMVSAEAYGTTWLAQMEPLAPGENTADPNRLPRSLRIPFAVDAPSELNNTQLVAMTAAHPEMTNLSYSFRAFSEPTVPPDVDDNPRILAPRHFGIYSV